MGDTTISQDVIDGVNEIIAEMGRTINLRVRVNSGSNFNPTITYTDNNIESVVVDYKIREIDGTLIKQSDKKFIFLSTFEPILNDLIVDAGKTYSIINISIVEAVEETVLYKVQGRI